MCAPHLSPGRKRVFVSYSRFEPDARLAEQLHEALRGSHDVFFDRLIRSGENWERRIEQELKAADYFVVLLSERSVNEEGLQGEIEIACELAKENEGRPIIFPVRVRFESRLPYSVFMRLRQVTDVIFERKRRAAGIPFDGGGNGVATVRQSREFECAIGTEESRLRVKGAIGADGDAHYVVNKYYGLPYLSTPTDTIGCPVSTVRSPEQFLNRHRPICEAHVDRRRVFR